MIIASKRAAGVTGAGLATLAGGLSAHRPELLDGVGLIVGIDRFMSEARALTNFAGNAIATVLVATWTSQLDRNRLSAALSGEAPFDEATVLDDDHEDAAPDVGSNAGPGQRDAESAVRDLATRSPH
jgi:aerobic C4-dicarboxylate transport protein